MNQQLLSGMTNSQVPRDDLCDLITQMLHDYGSSPFSDVKVSVQNRHALITGQVPTYHHKQMAQAIVMSADEIESIRNNLIVKGG